MLNQCKIRRFALCASFSLVIGTSTVSAVEQAAAVGAPVAAPATESIDAHAEKGALSLTGPVEKDQEPIYAGTSMWFLLSIALLSSIAVKRRVDTLD